MRPGRPTRRRDLLLGSMLLLAGLALLVAVRAGWFARDDAAAPPAPVPLPVRAKSPFLNTGPEASYVGSEACRSCHGQKHAAFHATPMGRSMALVDPATAPPDGEFTHAASQRRYRVQRKDGQLWHRELLLTDGRDEIVLAEFPLKYVLGSGHHWINYLVEPDGFLVESPVTWYVDLKQWRMSPGYDSPHQEGFARPITEGCLFCHASQARTVGGSHHRMEISEVAIGCERCHGPGSLHVQYRSRPAQDAATERSAAIDHTIVNPAHLSRELGEAVCQQCHLRLSATVLGRGSSTFDYRPGLPLQDFRADYQLDVPNSAMTVVGHVEQMHQSRCYQRSETLTCLTCHDPHDTPAPARRVEYFKAICQSCHAAEKCTLGAAERVRQGDDCVACHMPRAPSSHAIPHLAFTHHRIGKHAGAAQDKPAPQLGALRAFLDLSRLGALDEKRALGLAYHEVAARAEDEPLSVAYRGRALELLLEVYAAGLRDAVLLSNLGRLSLDLQREFAGYAIEALDSPDLAGQHRCNALFLMAQARLREGRHQEAAALVHELSRARRHHYDWLLLASCEKAAGNADGIVRALEQAVAINPRLWQVHEQLAQMHTVRGDAARAQWHRVRAVR